MRLEIGLVLLRVEREGVHRTRAVRVVLVLQRSQCGTEWGGQAGAASAATIRGARATPAAFEVFAGCELVDDEERVVRA